MAVPIAGISAARFVASATNADTRLNAKTSSMGARMLLASAEEVAAADALSTINAFGCVGVGLVSAPAKSMNSKGSMSKSRGRQTAGSQRREAHHAFITHHAWST